MKLKMINPKDMHPKSWTKNLRFEVFLMRFLKEDKKIKKLEELLYLRTENIYLKILREIAWIMD